MPLGYRLRDICACCLPVVAGGSIYIRGCIRPCYISTSGQKSEQWVYDNMENGLQSKKLHFRADGQLIADMEVGTDGAFAHRARDGE